MNRLVLDASVLIKLFVPEDGSEAAEIEVKKAAELWAPDLVWAEAGNILWKYVRRGELLATDATKLLVDMRQMPLQIIAAGELIDLALQIAVDTERTVYDALYVSAAVDSKAVLLTADARLANALAATRWAKHVRPLRRRS